MLLMPDLTPLNKLFHSRERPVMLFQLFSYTQMYPFNCDKSFLQWPSTGTAMCYRLTLLLPAVMQKGDPHTPVKEQAIFINAPFPVSIPCVIMVKTYYSYWQLQAGKQSSFCQTSLLLYSLYLFFNLQLLFVWDSHQLPTVHLWFWGNSVWFSVILACLKYRRACIICIIIYIIASHDSYIYISVIWEFHMASFYFSF